MGARAAVLLLVVGLSGIAAAGDPKPKDVDVKAIKDKLEVFEDAQGGTYAVWRDAATRDSRAFYGPTNKELYEQRIVNRSSNDSDQTWSIGLWVPRISGIAPASIWLKQDGGYYQDCAPDATTASDNAGTPLKRVPADRAKVIVAKAKFLTTGIVYRALRLARDDSGVYYYVDELTQTYGGGGTRLWVGRKGAMKQLPLLDTARDSAGEVYSTKSGDVRFVFDHDESNPKVTSAEFIKGDKKSPLRTLGVEINSRLAYRDLGIYQFTGTPCESF